MKLGFILAEWDETLGPDTKVVYPKGFIEDADLLAIKYFSSSQFIFGGEEFVQLSFVMPLIYLHLDARLFFDYMETSSVRGGSLHMSHRLYIYFQAAELRMDRGFG